MLDGLRRLDLRLFDHAARARSPLLDRVLPKLSRIADYGRLWISIAAALALVGGHRGQRAARRGLVSLAITSAIVNAGLKPVLRRRRPSLRLVPSARHLLVQPASTSFPSGHSASAAAFATGASLELPLLAPALGLLAGAVAYSRVHVGVHYPSDVLAGCAVGSAIALLGKLRSSR